MTGAPGDDPRAQLGRLLEEDPADLYENAPMGYLSALPDGRRAWPDIGAIWAAIPGATQIQLVQLGLDHVEVRFVRAEPLSPAEEQAITRSIHQALGHPFHLTFEAEETIARQPNGKYETFIDAR